MTDADFEILLKNLNDKETTQISVSQPFTEIQLSKFCNALANNKHLITLMFMPAVALGDEGGRVLAEALEVNTALKALYLSKNRIGDLGASYLATMLLENKGLLVLMLNRNHITAEGAKAIAESLESNQTLTSLAIAKNKLGELGAISFGRMLSRNKHLAWLNLGFNDIGEIGIEALSLGLSCNDDLEHLCIADNPKMAAQMYLFTEMLKNNHTLKSVDCSFNHLGDEATSNSLYNRFATPETVSTIASVSSPLRVSVSEVSSPVVLYSAAAIAASATTSTFHSSSCVSSASAAANPVPTTRRFPPIPSTPRIVPKSEMPCFTTSLSLLPEGNLEMKSEALKQSEKVQANRERQRMRPWGFSVKQAMMQV